MDDTSQRPHEAGATRKRRSSILKAVRPARAPLSELEFNVATPTDTTKSRRVSFSRRTGVAEFVTNEATTTWKNLYEEQNHTLETSQEASDRPTVAQLGNRLIDRQFQEVISIDFDNGKADLSQVQVASCNLDNTDSRHIPTLPQQKFELSQFTDQQSKVFTDDLAISGMGELTDKISFNFSSMQPIGHKRDDLEDMVKDLELQDNLGFNCPGPNVSEYIEVDLNMTTVAPNQSDMSITDTIHSPKVNVSKNTSTISNNKDFILDKENILLNPYIAPKESDNFAINEECDKVWVFDGKRLTMQHENPQRNVDLPNYVEDATTSKLHNLTESLDVKNNTNKTIMGDFDLSTSILVDKLLDVNEPSMSNISITKALTGQIIVNNDKRKTINYQDDGNVSVTQALPTNIISSENERHKTIVYENDGDISITQAVPSHILPIVNDKRRTTVFESDADISITQAVPANLIMLENNPDNARRRTIIYDQDCDISMTQAIPTNLIMTEKENPVTGRRQTIIYDNNGDISMTQAIPTNLIMTEKENLVTGRRQTIIYDNNGDISMTQAIPTNLIMTEKENPVNLRRQTIIYDNNENNGDISITQAIPSNLIMPENNPGNARRQTIVYENNGDISMTQAIPTNILDVIEKERNKKRETIVFVNETADISATQAVDNNLILAQLSEPILSSCETNVSKLSHHSDQGRRKTVIFEDGNISVTQAIPSNIIMAQITEQKRKTIVFEDTDISITKPVPANIISSLEPSIATIQNSDTSNKNTEGNMSVNDKSMKIDMNMSITQALPTNLQHSLNQEEKRKTVIPENDNGDIEMTQGVSESPVTRTLVSDQNHVSETLHILMPRALVSDTDQVTDTTVTTSVESVNRNSNSDDADVSMTDESKIQIGFETSSNMINNFASAMIADTSNTTSNVSSYYSIATSKGSDSLMKKKEILENCLKIVDLAQKAKGPNQNNLRDTIVYQTTSDVHSMNAMKPKAIEFIPSTMETASNEKPSVNTLSDKSTFQDDKKYFAVTPNSKPTIPIPSTNEKLIEKVNSESSKENSKHQTSNETISSDLSKIGQELKNTILNDLLDMANASVDIQGDGYDDKSVTAKIDSENPSIIAKDKNPIISPRRTMSGESFFFIKDEEECAQTENSDEDRNSKRKIDVRLPIVDSKPPEDVNLTTSPKEPTITIKRSPRTSPGNRYFEKVRSPDIKVRSPESNSERRNRFRDVRDAESTKELIEMLSDFTDKEEEHNPLQPMQVQHKNKEAEPRRFTLPPRRHSVVLSREDLLNNISLATTLLQKSRFEDSTLIDENDTTIEKSCQKNQADVVKTLRFEEDSYSDVAEMVSPLKKTAFGESSYMKERESKGNVIPSYLKDVSDGLKQLMSDLVKPIADTLPFNTLKPDIVSGLQNPSTCSMQIEANLITSSQIDVDIDSRSEENVLNPSTTRNRKGIIKSPQSKPPSNVSPIKRTIIYEPSQDTYSKVVIFDRENPLNNVLLTPIDFSAAHKYSPPDNESEPESLRQSSQVKFRRDEDNIDNPKQYNVETCIAHFNHIPGGDNGVENVIQSQSKTSVLSKPVSVDVEIDSSPNMKCAEANTVIAMKGVRQLLQESSSLTLVDDLENPCSKPSSESICLSDKTSNFKVLYSNEDKKLESDLQSLDEAKTMKRPYSPTKHDKNKPTNDTTPKQTTKVRKISKSPIEKSKISPKTDKKYHESNGKVLENKKSPTKSPKNESNGKVLENKKSPTKSPKNSSPKYKKPSSPIAVQQLITEYHIATGKNENKDLLDLLTSSSGSSDPKEALTAMQNNLGDDISSLGSKKYSQQSPMDWQPELINEQSSKDLVIEREGDIDVLAKVDKLPFMGSRDCEWESSTVEAWSFRVLRGRLRLTVRFMHGTRRVRGDTPLLIVTVDPLQNEYDPVAASCVTFAAYAMRDAATKASKAGDVPGLLRRSAGIARVAARWARAMLHAQVRLAYSLTFDGKLALKVANVNLRSVFEVTMHIQMERDADSAPYPRATEVCVHSVIGEKPTDGAVRKALNSAPSDWGHAPHVLWKIFKHLKNQKADEIVI